VSRILKANLILSAVMNMQDNYGKMIEKLFNYFATIILQKISWRVFVTRAFLFF
jgi:hypothetical protein